MLTALADKALVEFGVSAGSLSYSLSMLAVNLLIGWITLSLLRSYARIERRRVAAPRPAASPEYSGVAKS